MYDIRFITQGGTTTNSAYTWENAVKEAARILADQTDQCWTWWEKDAQRVNNWLSLDGTGRVNGAFEPERWRINITGETA